jgi:hypothetical protein
MVAVASRGSRSGPNLRRLAAAVAVLAVLVVVQWIGGEELPGRRALPDQAPAAGRPDDSRRIAELFAERRSGEMVEARGAVSRLLPDDRDGSRHQRFLLRLEAGSTLLVAHNIDLAPRVPLEPGDVVRFRGQYEWNDRGGVVHWTHHDPDGRRAGGWLEHEGRRYR